MLKEKLLEWESQINKLGEAESNYFNLEASEKSFFSDLVIRSDQKTIAMKEHEASASQAWTIFKSGLAESKSFYNKQRRILELKMKSFDASYLEYKLNNEYIRKPHA